MAKRWIVLIAVLVIAACGQKEESPDSTASRGTAGSEPAQSVSGDIRLTWSAPEGWIEEQPGTALRLAQYRLPKVEGDDEDATAAVFHFQGAGGSVDANLQRWFGQFAQPDGTPSAEAAKIETAERNGLEQTIVDVSGTFRQTTTPMGPEGPEKPNYRMLAGIIETPTGPWFVKLIGPEKTVARWEPSFRKFMESVERER